MIQAQRVKELLSRGETLCLATVVLSGRPELPAGAKILVLRDGTVEGPDLPADWAKSLRATASEALARKTSRMAEVTPGVRVFLDVVSPEVKLLVCGAGHIALPLARFAREVGFQVTVLDDRPDFAAPARFPGCEVVAEDFTEALKRMPLGPDTFVVVVTRGHEHDLECLLQILPKDTAYVGLIGSRRRVGFVKIELERQGIPGARVEQMYTPIGLPIGAESPAEIALCITAELVAVRRKGNDQARAVRGERRGQ